MAFCGDELNVWSAMTTRPSPMLALGAKGLISVTANLVPEPMAELTHSYFRGEVEEARELQLSYLPPMKALFSQVNPIPIKALWRNWALTAAASAALSGPMDKKPARNSEKPWPPSGCFLNRLSFLLPPYQSPLLVQENILSKKGAFLCPFRSLPGRCHGQHSHSLSQRPLRCPAHR